VQPRDWLWLASLALGAFVAWQNQAIQLGIERLRSELLERIAKAKRDVKALQARRHE